MRLPRQPCSSAAGSLVVSLARSYPLMQATTSWRSKKTFLATVTLRNAEGRRRISESSLREFLRFTQGDISFEPLRRRPSMVEPTGETVVYRGTRNHFKCDSFFSVIGRKSGVSRERNWGLVPVGGGGLPQLAVAGLIGRKPRRGAARHRRNRRQARWLW